VSQFEPPLSTRCRQTTTWLPGASSGVGRTTRRAASSRRGASTPWPPLRHTPRCGKRAAQKGFQTPGTGRATSKDRFMNALQSRLRVRIRLAPPSSPSFFGHLGELREVRAWARDLRARLDPENVSSGANRENRLNPIPARFCQVHQQERMRLRAPSRSLVEDAKEALPTSRRQSNECPRPQGYQALAREGDLI
jgi:hypothetical protein